jgi:hypothetical protein
MGEIPAPPEAGLSAKGRDTSIFAAGLELGLPTGQHLCTSRNGVHV